MKDFVIGSIVGAFFTFGMLGFVDVTANELPITFIEPVYKSEMTQLEAECSAYGNKAKQVMYDRQFGVIGEDTKLHVEALGTPVMRDAELKGVAVIEFGARMQGKCLIDGGTE